MSAAAAASANANANANATTTPAAGPAANDSADQAANDVDAGAGASASEVDTSSKGDQVGQVNDVGGGAAGAGDAEGDGEGAKGEGDPKDQSTKKLPPSLRAALRAEKRAKAAHLEAQASETRAKALTEQAQAAVQRQRAELEAWQRQVDPQLRRLSQLEGAAKAGRVGDVVRGLGLDPRTVLEALQEEAANPIPEAVRRELEESRAEREARKAEEDRRRTQEEQQRASAATKTADLNRLHVALEVGDFPGLSRFRSEHGDQLLLGEAYAVQRQMQEAGLPLTMKSLVAELEARAAKLYGPKKPDASADAAATSATPAPKAGQVQPGKTAAPAAPAGGKKPSAVTSSMAASQSSSAPQREMSDAEYDEEARRHLRELRKKR